MGETLTQRFCYIKIFLYKVKWLGTVARAGISQVCMAQYIAAQKGRVIRRPNNEYRFTAPPPTKRQCALEFLLPGVMINGLT